MQKRLNFRDNLITLLLVIIVLIIDQGTKYLAKILLQPRRSISILGDFFRLTYVENPGMAFGIQIGNRFIFNSLSIIAVIVIFYYLFILRHQLMYRVSFSFILGGAFGNLLDRFLRGRVIDFLDVDFFNVHFQGGKFLFFNLPAYSMDRWPVFNIADVAVSIGMIMIILITLFDSKAQESAKNVPSKEV